LPFFLHPTLMLNISWISAKTGGFWRALNFPGVYVADAGGPEAKHFSLLPVTGELPFLTPREADALADEYQRQFLMLRLRLLVPRQQAGGDSDVSSPDPIGSAVRWHLPLFLQGEPEIVKALTPLLEAHEQERLARHFLDPHVAIVEAVWAAAHAGKEISGSMLC
jgi:hypothetical protein